MSPALLGPPFLISSGKEPPLGADPCWGSSEQHPSCFWRQVRKNRVSELIPHSSAALGCLCPVTWVLGSCFSAQVGG